MARFYLNLIPRNTDDYGSSPTYKKVTNFTLSGLLGDLRVGNPSLIEQQISGSISTDSRTGLAEYINIKCNDENIVLDLFWGSHERPKPLSKMLVQAAVCEVDPTRRDPQGKPLMSFFVRSWIRSEAYHSDVAKDATFVEGLRIDSYFSQFIFEVSDRQIVYPWEYSQATGIPIDRSLNPTTQPPL